MYTCIYGQTLVDAFGPFVSLLSTSHQQKKTIEFPSKFGSNWPSGFREED